MTQHRSFLTAPTEHDDRLVAAAVAGDDRAFCALADSQRRVLHAHCRRILGSSSDADDAVQEALLRAWRRRDTFQARSSFGWWLRRIATNACIEIVRRDARSRRLAHRLDNGSPSNGSDAYESTTNPAAVFITKEAVHRAYLVAIRTLPERQRTVFVLRDVLRCSAVETADLLDDTVASVNSALQRARVKLKRCHRIAMTAEAPPATPAERDLVRRLVDAHDRGDVSAVAALLEHASPRVR